MDKKLRKNCLFVPLIIGLLVLAMSGPAATAPTPAGGKTGCVTWTTEARYEGLGFNHYVHLKSACKEVMVCSVTTNANPDPTVATLPPGGKASVVTYKGSPASEFTATVTCQKKLPN
ncbi:MAG: hypothetical protein GY762_16455 [Proteobacteria bacterium]|nr:hypothetical protein [Pseudomonadota bacterium]